MLRSCAKSCPPDRSLPSLLACSSISIDHPRFWNVIVFASIGTLAAQHCSGRFWRDAAEQASGLHLVKRFWILRDGTARCRDCGVALKALARVVPTRIRCTSTKVRCAQVSRTKIKEDDARDEKVRATFSLCQSWLSGRGHVESSYGGDDGEGKKK